MQRVGVREFKNRATQIVRDVREHSASYVITVDGEPVATVRPYEQSDEPGMTAEVDEWLRSWNELTAQVAAIWPSNLSAVDAVREQRRELPCP